MGALTQIQWQSSLVPSQVVLICKASHPCGLVDDHAVILWLPLNSTESASQKV